MGTEVRMSGAGAKADVRLISTGLSAKSHLTEEALSESLADDVGTGAIDTLSTEVGPGGFARQLQEGVPFELWRGAAIPVSTSSVWDALAQSSPAPEKPADTGVVYAGDIAIETRHTRQRHTDVVPEAEQFEPTFAAPKPTGGAVPWPGAV